MSLVNSLEALDEKYYNQEEEDYAGVIDSLAELHEQSLLEGMEEFRKFSAEVITRCGGIYIPFILWTELSVYSEKQGNHQEIFDIIQAFVTSDFEKDVQKKMKTLLIPYFSMEREFEVNKIMSLIVEKSHPDVQEYFRKIHKFSEKNQKSVLMYVEKFQLVKEYSPNFDMMRLPLSKLKEQLSEAE